MTYIPFARQSASDGETLDHSGERLLNCLAEPIDGKGAMLVRGVSGLERFGDLDADGEVRALCPMNGVLFAAAGGRLWRIKEDGAAEDLGGIADGPAVIACGGTEVAVVAGGIYHLWDGTTITTPDTADLTDIQGVAYLDGYFILIGSADGRGDAFIVTGIDDGATIRADDLIYARASTDALVAVRADHGEVALFGRSTLQFAYNAGEAVGPIRTNPTAVVEAGCSEPRTVASVDNGLFWVGPGGIVYRSDGVSPQVISTRQVERALTAATVLGALILVDGGHKVYTVILKDEAAWSYDLTTGLWGERGSGVDGGEWIGRVAHFAWGNHFVGARDGRLYRLSASRNDEAGAPLLREAISPPLVQGGRRFPINRLVLGMETGTSDLDRPASITFAASDDGRRWRREMFREVGRQGDYEERVPFHGLGAFRRAQFRVRMTDDAPFRLSGVSIG